LITLQDEDIEALASEKSATEKDIPWEVLTRACSAYSTTIVTTKPMAP